ncbi:LIM/homeobox protein Lhx2 [Fasciola gigantica]|uniref:LIM/homeobox protein Lhx2 n=1 Tax=Fasciola gigantica TaxID=46835 RepID=A0A504Y4P9_FASGI|nr:LIM/homeobox protein Lhx2 [Fasciola gigantica]
MDYVEKLLNELNNDFVNLFFSSPITSPILYCFRDLSQSSRMSTNYIASNSVSNDSYSSMGPLMCLPASYPIQDEPCTDQWLPPQWLYRFQIVPKMSSHQTVSTLPEVDGAGRESVGDGTDYRDFSPDNDIKSEFTADSHSNPCLWARSSFSSHISLTKRCSDVLAEPVPVTHSTPASLGFEQPKSEPNVNGQTTFSSTTSTAFSQWKTNPTCAGCDQLMNVDKPCLRLSDGRLWHVDCLVCAQCTKPLHLDPSCFSREGNIYCKEDYQRLFKMNKLFPVCAACQQPIHALDLIMRVSGTIYHYTCFTCTQCTRMLRPGDQFFVRHGQLVCGQFVCQVRANKERDHDRTISRTPSPGQEEEITPCDYDRDPLPTQFPFPFILPRSELVQEDQPAEKMTLTEQHTAINHKKHSLSEFNPDEARSQADRPVITPTCEQLSDLSEYNPLIELTIPPRDNACLGSPHQFGFEFNPNPAPHHFFEPESDSVPASFPFPATTSPRSRIYPSPNENGLNSVVIPYPHSNRSPTHSSVTSSSLGSLSTHSLIRPIQNCLCPIPSMGPSGICEDLTKMATYSSFLPTSGVTLVPSSPRIGPNPLLNAPTGLLKLISPGASMLYGQTSVTSPNSGPLSLGSSSQKRNRKRRAGLHQNFDAVCLTGPNGYCLGLSQRQKRMRTSFKHHQLRAMKAYFNMNHNPDVKDLKVLTEKTGLSKRVLQVRYIPVCKNRSICTSAGYDMGSVLLPPHCKPRILARHVACKNGLVSTIRNQVCSPNSSGKNLFSKWMVGI